MDSSSSSTNCPLCETESHKGMLPPSSPKPTSRLEEIARLLDNAERLDNAMQSIIEKKNAIMRELNNIQPPTSLLPFELLSYIFQLASPPIDFSERSLCESEYDDDYLDNMTEITDMYPQPRNQVDLRYRYFPLALSNVCSLWRTVAWMTPGLWTTFAVEVIAWKLKSQVPLIRLYLTNSGTQHVSLDLDMRIQHCAYVDKHDDNASQIQLRAFQPLANLIFDEFPHKIKTLRLAGAPPAWMAYLSEERLPNLRDLTFGWGADAGDVILVKLEGGAFTAAAPEWDQLDDIAPLQPIPKARPPLPPLTTLHLRNVHLNLCAKILYYTPCLVEYYVYEPSYTPPDLVHTTSWHFTPFQESYSLPALKRFGWTAQDSESVNINLLTNIRLPSLEEVQLGGFSEDILVEDAEAVICFFSNLPQTVHSLSYYEQDSEFFDSSDDYHHHRRVFSIIPQIRSLVFNKCSGCFLRSIFSLLATKFPGSKPQCLLPSLNRIVVRSLDQDGDDMSVAFVEMLKSRRSILQSKSFLFEAVDCEMTWSRSAQDGLRELAYDFALTVREKSEERIYGFFTEWELDILTTGSEEEDETARPPNNPTTQNFLWEAVDSALWTNAGAIAGPKSWENFTADATVATGPQPSASSSTVVASEGGQAGMIPDMASDIWNPSSGPIFSPAFMQSIANVLDSIDPTLFRPEGDTQFEEGDTQFERDFGQWFNHLDDSLDLK